MKKEKSTYPKRYINKNSNKHAKTIQSQMKQSHGYRIEKRKRFRSSKNVYSIVKQHEKIRIKRDTHLFS